MHVTHRNTAVAAAIAGLLVPPVALSQAGTVEEIVVTAQKREQTLQEVPIAVSAFSASQLERAGVNDVRDLMSLSPSLMFTSSQAEAAGAVARIRGVGTTGDNAGLESAVAVFVDGVYRNRNSVALTDLGQIERIEVLRGPQGTLFGKNASAGLIHVITAGPEWEHNAYADLTGGNYGYMRVAAGITGPLADDTVAFRLDGNFTQRDGFINDLLTGDDYNDRDRLMLRGQLAIEPGEVFSARLIGDWSTRDESCCAAVTLIDGPTTQIIQALGGTMVVPAAPFERNTTANPERGYQQDVDEWGLSAELAWDLEDISVTSITAWRDWELDRSQDIDFTNADILYRAPGGGYLQGFETLTQELRVGGQAGRTDWMIGAFYADEQLTLQDAIRAGADFEPYLNALLGGNLSLFTGLPPGSNYLDGQGAQRDAFRQDAESWALFTHNTVMLTDRLDLTLGLRYTEERKRMSADLASINNACLATVPRLELAGQTIAGQLIGAGVPPAEAAARAQAQVTQAAGLICLPFFNPLLESNPFFPGIDGTYEGRRTDSEWTGTISLAYDLTDEINGYVSFGRGFKAGGFNLDRAGLANPLTGQMPSAADLEFGAETVESWEVGLKSQLLQNALTVNVAAFYSDFSDFQLNTFTGVNFVVDNLETARTKGVELEFFGFATDALTLSGGVTYADARYGSNVAEDALAGRRLTSAPLWSGSLAATWEQPISATLNGLLHMDVRYTGGHNTGSDLDIEKVQGGYAVWNARVGIGGQDERWALELWARNLFDKDYQQVAFDAPLQGSGTGPGATQTFNSFLAEPRLWGATLRLKF